MADNGYITPAAGDRRRTTKPIALQPGNRTPSAASPTSSTTSQQQLIEKYGAGVYRKGGLKVYTTIDPKLQEAGRATRSTAGSTSPATRLGDRLDRPAQRLHPGDGVVRQLQRPHFNLAAQGHRQPGSTFKPFVLTDRDPAGGRPRQDVLRVEAART